MNTWEIFGIIALCIIGIVATIIFVVSRTDATPSEQLVSIVHNKYPQTANASDQNILSIGNYTCESLGNGGTVVQAFDAQKDKYRYDAEADHELIKFVMIKSVSLLCPQYINKTKGF